MQQLPYVIIGVIITSVIMQPVHARNKSELAYHYGETMSLMVASVLTCDLTSPTQQSYSPLVWYRSEPKTLSSFPLQRDFSGSANAVSGKPMGSTLYYYTPPTAPAKGYIHATSSFLYRTLE
jgi:hypothetical protein